MLCYAVLDHVNGQKSGSVGSSAKCSSAVVIKTPAEPNTVAAVG